MLRMIIFIALISAVTGSRREGTRIITALLTMMAVMFGLQILMFTGFAILPCIIVFALLGNVVIPFIRGFMSRF